MDTYKSLFEKLEEELSAIAPLDEEAKAAAFSRQQTLAKPPGSLGVLEDLSVQLAGITGEAISRIERSAILIFSADNGVTAEGVSSAPKSVTLSQTINFTRKLTGVGALAETFGIDLLVTDMGIDGPVPEQLSSKETDDMFSGMILDRRLAGGTGNIRKEPAMSLSQAVRGILTGIEVSRAAADAGYDILGVGEMGIGNTTTAAALLSVLLGIDPDIVTGRGGGLLDSAFELKKTVIRDAIDRFERSDHYDTEQPVHNVLRLISELGGFDIAAMTGAFLGAAASRVPVVIDGYISAVAAMLACRLQPLAKEYMIPSHASAEPGYDCAIKDLGLRPLFDLDMRLGEGSGCAIAFQIVKAACGAMEHTATFEEAAIDDDYLTPLRQDK